MKAPANPKACVSCPWRLKNQGKPHPDGWFTAANLKRLWAKLRHGEMMSCHRTDPNNPVPEGQQPVPEGTTTHECAGALTLQQRELMNFQDIAKVEKKALKVYKQQHPQGMTRDGLTAIVERAMFGGTSIGGLKMSKPNLNDPEVGYSKLNWKPRGVGDVDR